MSSENCRVPTHVSARLLGESCMTLAKVPEKRFLCYHTNHVDTAGRHMGLPLLWVILVCGILLSRDACIDSLLGKPRLALSEFN